MKIIQGKRHEAPKIVIYGPSGVGKSTFAANASKPLALNAENGLEQIGCDRVDLPEDWSGSLSLLREMCIGPGAWETVILDTIDKLEDQAAKSILAEHPTTSKGKKVSCLADYGWGDGFEMLAAKWRELLFLLESARAHRRTVILVGHVTKFAEDDPVLGGRTTRYAAAVDKRVWGATHRWADAILFARYETGVADNRTVMLGGRELRTQAGTGFDAKNRWSLPDPLPLSWQAFSDAVSARQREADAVIQSIRALASSDPGLTQKAEDYLSKAGQDVNRLIVIESELRKKVSA